MGEISVYLYADRSNSIERGKTNDAGGQVMVGAKSLGMCVKKIQVTGKGTGLLGAGTLYS